MKDKFSVESLENFWNNIAKQMKPFHSAPSTQYYFRRERELFENWFGNLKGKKLLKSDLWNEAKNTKILVWACKQGAKVYGFDISKEIIKGASRTFKKEKLKSMFKYGDMRKIPFGDNKFDFFYSMGTVEHTPQYEKSIKELQRVLKPGGIGIIGVPNKYPIFDIYRYPMFKVLDKFNLFPYGYEKHFSKLEFEKLLKKCGFKVLDSSTILSFPFVLRALDLSLYKRKKKLCKPIEVFLKPFEKMETSIRPLKNSWGYLLAFKVTKR